MGDGPAAGWQLVTTDNWVGTIPATTVYYPARLKAAALLLGKDLGIERIIELDLDEEERKALHRSAETLRRLNPRLSAGAA